MASTTDLLAPHLVRAIMYIKVANDGGAYPSANALDLYAVTREPYARRRVSIAGLTDFTDLIGTVRDAQPVSKYMRKMDWIEDYSTGIRLTPLGRGIALGLLSEENVTQDAEDEGYVLSPDDPARYELLIRALNAAGGGMLIDPYLKADQVKWLCQATTLRRIVLSSTKQGITVITAVSHVLGNLSNSLPEFQLEARTSADDRLHDRILVGEDDNVWQIGASLNGLDKNVTAIMRLPDSLLPQVREFAESIWSEASPLQPRTGMTEIEAAQSDAPDEQVK